MIIPRWLTRLLRRRLHPPPHHIPTPTVTTPIQRDLITNLTADDQKRLERLTREVENALPTPSRGA